MNDFIQAYIECALWSSTDDDWQPLNETFSISDIDPATLLEMFIDCQGFWFDHRQLIAGRESEAGHDFWLTRNGHGAGFWDGDWPEPAATILDKGSRPYGEYSLYIGDDGKVYGS